MDDLAIAWRPLGELIPTPAIRALTPMPRWRRSPRASVSLAGLTRCSSMAQSGIIAGHGRVLAARKLELERVPVIELAHMSEAQKRAYRAGRQPVGAECGLG